MGEDEGEEINAKVGKDVAHPPVGVHGAVDYLSRNAGQHKGCGEHGGLSLLFYLEETFLLSHQTDDNRNLELHKISCYIHVSSDYIKVLQQSPSVSFITSFSIFRGLKKSKYVSCMLV